jgi:hypothetical protein
MKKERTDTSRFSIGELVRINTTIMSRRSFQIGRVITMRVSSRARTLDKYVVGFADDARETFWDIQLEAVQLPEELESSNPRQPTNGHGSLERS